jgi:hypothetical protein
MLAALEAITGLFYRAVLISRLVSVYSSARPGSLTNSAATEADPTLRPKSTEKTTDLRA